MVWCSVVGCIGVWWLRPILVFSLSLGQAEQLDLKIGWRSIWQSVPYIIIHPPCQRTFFIGSFILDANWPPAANTTVISLCKNRYIIQKNYNCLKNSVIQSNFCMFCSQVVPDTQILFGHNFLLTKHFCWPKFLLRQNLCRVQNFIWAQNKISLIKHSETPR